MRFVVVDDSGPIRDELRRIIRNMGHEVVGVGSNGYEAIDLCKKLKPDAVTLDINMPILDGVAPARQFLEDGEPQFVFILSSMAQKSQYEPLMDAGATFIGKPFQPDTVVKFINRAINGKS